MMARSTAIWAGHWEANIHNERVNLQACAAITPGIVASGEERLRRERAALASVPRSVPPVAAGDPKERLVSFVNRALALRTWQGAFRRPAPSLGLDLRRYEGGKIGAEANRCHGEPRVIVWYDDDDARNLWLLLHELAHLVDRPAGHDPYRLDERWDPHGPAWRYLMHASACEWILNDPHPFSLTDDDAAIIAAEVAAYEQALVGARARVTAEMWDDVR